MNIRTFWKGALASGGNPVLPQVAPDATPTARTFALGTTTLVASDLNGISTNTGATTSVVLVLPSATTSDTKALKVQVTVASSVVVVPASGDKIFLGGSGAANATLNIAGVIGNYADLYSDGSNWMVVGYSGVLTKV